MSEDIVLRTGEAARRRRRVNRANREERRCIDDHTNEMKTEKPKTRPVPPTMPSNNNWFSVMLARPLTRRLSAMEKFNVYCGFFYMVLAVSCLTAPGVAADIFNMQLNKAAEGYGRLAGVYFLAIGLCYATAARSSPRHVPAKRILLGTVFERLIYVNLVLVLLYVKHGGNLLFTASLMMLDTILSLITLMLWTRETSSASLLSAVPWALKKVLQLLPPTCEPTTRRSSSVCQIMGYLQGLVGTVFIISPDIAGQALQLSPFEGQSKYFLGLCMMTFSVVGILHIFAGAADSVSFNVMAVFMRLAVLIPVTCALLALGLIEIGLAGFLVGFDLVTATIIGLFLLMEGLDQKHQ